eukprot:g17824.t1
MSLSKQTVPDDDVGAWTLMDEPHVVATDDNKSLDHMSKRDYRKLLLDIQERESTSTMGGDKKTPIKNSTDLDFSIEPFLHLVIGQRVLVRAKTKPHEKIGGTIVELLHSEGKVMVRVETTETTHPFIYSEITLVEDDLSEKEKEHVRTLYARLGHSADTKFLLKPAAVKYLKEEVVPAGCECTPLPKPRGEMKYMLSDIPLAFLQSTRLSTVTESETPKSTNNDTSTPPDDPGASSSSGSYAAAVKPPLYGHTDAAVTWWEAVGRMTNRNPARRAQEARFKVGKKVMFRRKIPGQTKYQWIDGTITALHDDQTRARTKEGKLFYIAASEVVLREDVDLTESEVTEVTESEC